MRKNCKVCRKPIKRITKPPAKDVPLSAYQDDPYCSRVCCEKDHGLSSAADKGPGVPVGWTKAAA